MFLIGVVVTLSMGLILAIPENICDCLLFVSFRVHDHVLLLPSGQQKAFTGTVEMVASNEVVLLVPEKAVNGL